MDPGCDYPFKDPRQAAAEGGDQTLSLPPHDHSRQMDYRAGGWAGHQNMDLGDI